ncbi:putative oligopeptide transporter, OPT superfamily [Dioscorea sansibarensis]
MLGVAACVIVSFVNQFFGYRTNAIAITSVCSQIVSLPLGKLMAATLPRRKFKFPFTNWTFSFNPGPFNIKEHVLITIIANAGNGGIYAVDIITAVKAFYHRKLNPLAAYLLCLTTQMLGYGWAGLFRKYLVDSPHMWWPNNLIQVSLFRTLHEDEKRPKGGLSRMQFFLTVFIISFCYYVFPGYLIPSISMFSVTCWIWKNSVAANIVGSGQHGLGIGSFGLDWSTISYNGSPLAYPAFAIYNIMAGFVITVYIITPIIYLTNTYNAKRFPIITPHVFDSDGQLYNITRILNQETFSINLKEYENYSQLNISAFFAITYGLSFASLTAVLSHVLLFNGKSIWKLWKETAKSANDKFADVHMRLMKRNYKAVPQWWFIILLLVVFGLSLFTCEGFGKQLQLPYWGIILACAIAFFFTLPVGVITATTNQTPGLNVVTEMVIGYIYPGKPLANVSFKTYGYISMIQALFLLQDLKLGHYMKIPPRSMFVAQLVGTIVTSSVYFGTSWWLLESIPNICNVALLPESSPWTCPGSDVFYYASIIWGVLGPLRMFGKLGLYSKMNYFFLIGALAPVPVWLLSRKFPEKKWIKLINMPILIGATANMPPSRSVNYITWFVVGFIFNVVIYKKYKGWWTRHNYVLSAAMDAGVAFMAILLFFSLQNYNIYGAEWWGNASNDHCPYASCPTAPGVVADGCPVFH